MKYVETIGKVVDEPLYILKTEDGLYAIVDIKDKTLEIRGLWLHLIKHFGEFDLGGKYEKEEERTAIIVLNEYKPDDNDLKIAKRELEECPDDVKQEQERALKKYRK